MRGKATCTLVNNDIIGITPAYAGKSAGDRLTIHIKWDHPRLCGEKLSGTLTPKTDSGSPPPMRGKVQPEPKVKTLERITPAYAGKRVGHDRKFARE